MKRSLLVTVIAASLALGYNGPIAAQVPPEVYIYPANDQDEEQQRTDKIECHGWAVDQSGFDPSLAALGLYMSSTESASENTAEDEGNSAIKNTARGAAAGALVGAVSGDVDVDQGAAIGAGLGAVGGGLRKRKENRQVNAQAEGRAEQVRMMMSSYGQAYKGCLEGRGYTIS